MAVAPQYKRLAGYVNIPVVVLSFVYMIILMASIFTWMGEGRIPIEFWVSFLSLVVLGIGYQGSKQQNEYMLLVLILYLSIFILLEIACIFIACITLILYLLNAVSFAVDSSGLSPNRHKTCFSLLTTFTSWLPHIILPIDYIQLLCTNYPGICVTLFLVFA